MGMRIRPGSKVRLASGDGPIMTVVGVWEVGGEESAAHSTFGGVCPYWMLE